MSIYSDLQTPIHPNSKIPITIDHIVREFRWEKVSFKPLKSHRRKIVTFNVVLVDAIEQIQLHNEN